MTNFILTVGDAAQAMGLSPDTIRSYEKKGKLRAMRTKRGQRLFQLDDVTRLIAERQKATERGPQ
jgi:excisionase family DNA binding protein